MAHYTYNGISRKLGSFEGLGKSLLGDQALGTFGFTLPDFTGGALTGGASCPDGSAPSDLRDQCGLDGKCYDSKGCPVRREYWQTIAPCGPRCANLQIAGDKAGYDKCCKDRYGADAGRTASEDTGPSAGEVLTGVGTILGSIASPLANIFATTQQARLERERLKRGGGARGGDPNAALYAALAARNQGGGGNTTVIVLAVVMLVVIVGAVLFLR